MLLGLRVDYRLAFETVGSQVREVRSFLDISSIEEPFRAVQSLSWLPEVILESTMGQRWKSQSCRAFLEYNC